MKKALVSLLLFTSLPAVAGGEEPIEALKNPRSSQEMLRDQVSVSEDAVRALSARLGSNTTKPMEHADFRIKVVDFEDRAIRALQNYEKEMKENILPLVQLHIDQYNSVASDSDTYTKAQRKALLENIARDSKIDDANQMRRRLLFKTLTAVQPLPIFVTTESLSIRELAQKQGRECEQLHACHEADFYAYYNGETTRFLFASDGNTDYDKTSALREFQVKERARLFEKTIGEGCFSRSCYLLTQNYLREWILLIENKLDQPIHFSTTDNQDIVLWGINRPLSRSRIVRSFYFNDEAFWQLILPVLQHPSNGFAYYKEVPGLNLSRKFRWIDDPKFEEKLDTYWVDQGHDRDMSGSLDLLSPLLHSAPPSWLPFDIAEDEITAGKATKEKHLKKELAKQVQLETEAKALAKSRQKAIDEMANAVGEVYNRKTAIYYRNRPQRDHCLRIKLEHEKKVCKVGEGEANPYFDPICLTQEERSKSAELFIRAVKVANRLRSRYETRIADCISVEPSEKELL